MTGQVGVHDRRGGALVLSKLGRRLVRRHDVGVGKAAAELLGD
jgi:hypothetical protein